MATEQFWEDSISSEPFESLKLSCFTVDTTGLVRISEFSCWEPKRDPNIAITLNLCSTVRDSNNSVHVVIAINSGSVPMYPIIQKLNLLFRQVLYPQQR